MRVCSVTVNYKTADLTLRGLAAVRPQVVALGGRCIIVDNDSQDGSFDKIASAIKAEGWDDHVDVIAAPKNAGFGAGNNLAFAHAARWDDKPDYFYLLNPDAYPDDDTVAGLVEFMDTHRDAGLAGSRVRHPNGALRLSAFRFPSVLSEVEQALHFSLTSRLLDSFKVVPDAPTRTCQVDWVSGASVMLRRAMVDELGGFDETFFLYFEETDLSLRAKRAGWSTWYVLEYEAEHIGQVSTGIKSKAKRRPEYWFQSRAHYIAKNHGKLRLLLANSAYVGASVLHKVRKRFNPSKDDGEPPHFFRDFVDFNFRGRLKP